MSSLIYQNKRKGKGIDMSSKREENYDWLRIISMIAVIVIHVSDRWVGGFSEYVSGGGSVNELQYPIMACVYNTISRFAVPCFIMLTGAFVLADNRTGNYKEFYQKKLLKIGIPTIIFSVLYIIYRIPFCFVGEQAGAAEIISLIKDIVRGKPFYHMWYLFMLIGLYLLAPIVVRFKDSISYEMFRRIAFVFLVLASLSRWTTENIRLNWDIGQSFEYLGYFMVGYVLRRDLQKNNCKGFFLITLGVLVEIATALAEYHFQIVNGIGENELQYKIVSPYCPSIVIASVLIFAGFSMLTIRCNGWMKKIVGMSFIVYLIHAGVWDFVGKIIYVIKGRGYVMSLNNIYWIPIFAVIVFLISVLLTVVYEKMMVYLMAKVKKNYGENIGASMRKL